MKETLFSLFKRLDTQPTKLSGNTFIDINKKMAITKG